MQFKSNIAAVISRTKRLQSHDIPSAMKRALNPAYWSKLAYAEAEKTLDGLAAKEQKQFVAPFLRTLKSLALEPAGFALTLGPVIPADASDWIGVQQQLPGVGDGKYAPLEFKTDGAEQEFRKLVDTWVETEKRWKPVRDQYGGDGEFNAANIASKSKFISYLLISPDLSTTASTPGRMSETAARDKLMLPVVEWIRAKMSEQHPQAVLDVETIDAWLRAVLSAWRNLVRDLFPQKFHTELLAVRGELALAGGQ